MAVLRLVLGDQLSHRIAGRSDLDLILLCVVQGACVRRHKKKITVFFSVMRVFFLNIVKLVPPEPLAAAA